MEAAPPLNIRALLPTDSPALAAIAQASPEASTWVTGAPGLVLHLAEKPVAFLLYRIVAGEGEILNLAVDPGHRRQGHAHRLLASVLPLAPLWHLEVRASNAIARALYERLGFRLVGERPRYYSDGETASLYSRDSFSAPKP